ncbi:CGNR zinc finger protein [Pseudonocardia hierapolitana]|uniref:CGNR zinc finger protein n=1 Tax=Pseudonocardia hierapolitana TaxID=1128676 RepID=A0A561SNU8_9PSEU|nr:CGNR zinc finger domain-containing protein [Pseudonocardia hierapolitana]TWF76528.1 CGNR zinc finger protein [Pseudonocardia hierapolitana]
MPRVEPGAVPEALVLLANLGRPRRPAGAAGPFTEPVLPDPAAASAQLGAVVELPVAEVDLADLRRLRRAASRAAEAILAGEALDLAEINALAAGATARVELVAADGGLRQRLVWADATPAAALARRLVEELSGLEPGRLRRCARPECDLLFYDTTRSRTRRWHAEDPCGWRERQRVHRGRRSGGTES